MSTKEFSLRADHVRIELRSAVRNRESEGSTTASFVLRDNSDPNMPEATLNVLIEHYARGTPTLGDIERDAWCKLLQGLRNLATAAEEEIAKLSDSS